MSDNTEEYERYTQIAKERHIWIELDVEERYKSIVYGRNKANVKCFIRILANLSAKRDKLAAFFM